MSSVSLWRAVFVLLFVIVTWLTVTPNPDDTETGMALTRWIAALLFGSEALGDKVAHFSAYGALGAVAYWGRITVGGSLWSAPALLALYGMLLEGAQALGGVRSAEIADAIANASGAISGFFVAYAMVRIIGRKAA